MPRLFMNRSASGEGALFVKKVSPHIADVYYVPSKERIIQSQLPADKATQRRVLLLHIDGQKRSLTIFPTNTVGSYSRFLKGKYRRIERITLANFDLPEKIFGDAVPSTADEVVELLEELPSGFTKDFDFGLGLPKAYTPIVNAVEQLTDCTEIVIADAPTSIDRANNVFHLAWGDFEDVRKTLDRITDLAQTATRSVKEATTYNLLAEKIGSPTVPVKVGRHPIRKLITDAAQGETPLAADEQDAVLNVLEENTRSIAKSKPEKLAKLRNDIELVTLEQLIERYEAMLGQALTEDRWQRFFEDNPFALSLAFGYPIIKVRDHASVGGRKITGAGDKVTDFLVKNSLTNNTALFEIKTPKTSLLNKKPYRDGIYTPSSDLAGALNQALDQKYQFQKAISGIKDTSRLHNIESYAVHCCLVIGRTPQDADQQKSFELFRRNSKDVEVITFDEMLEKLKQLRTFLADTGEMASQSNVRAPDKLKPDARH